MDIYKYFLERLRRLILEDHHLLLGNPTVSKLTEYVKYLLNIKFEDGLYHTYYGEIKKIITIFINYAFHTTDEVIIEADRYSQVASRQELLDLADNTIYVYENLQLDFAKDYLPVNSEENKIYHEILELHKIYVQNIQVLRKEIEKLDRQEKIDVFIKDHFKRTVKKTYETFEFAHAYLSMILSDRLKEIRISLEETLLRMRNNLRTMQQSSEENHTAVINQLYDKNKEHLETHRLSRRNSIENTEISCGIEKLRNKIEKTEKNIYITRLEEEVAYWERRVRKFEAITDNLMKLRAEKENCARQENVYNNIKTTELPGPKHQCWQTLGENFKERKEYLQEKIVEESRPLISFFCVRGTDRIFYQNNIGSYLMDELNHQVYHFDHSMHVYHLTCEGKFTEVSEQDKYYYDENGRYIYENGEKLYQSAPCAIKYKLDDDTLFVKVTKDCGHTDSGNVKCKMAINDLDNDEILPTSEPTDIKGTLNSETVKYLWESFGSILPDALFDVGTVTPKNPIHLLAHKLLAHKYNKSFYELRKKSKEADEFKKKIYNKRREKAVSASKAWKAKQVQRRKPEESDDTLHWAAIDTYRNDQQLIISQNYFYA